MAEHLQESIKPLSERIAEHLIGEILCGRYRAGDRLPSERELAVKHKANRGAVRESLRTLEQKGLAKVERGGARVIAVSNASLQLVGDLLMHPDYSAFDLIDQTLEAFAAMMGVAARRAIERGSEEQFEDVINLLEQVKPLTNEQMRDKMHEVGEMFYKMGGHLVLKLALNDMKLEIMPFIEQVKKDRSAPDEEFVNAITALQLAITNRDPIAAQQAIEHQFECHRKWVADLVSQSDNRTA